VTFPVESGTDSLAVAHAFLVRVLADRGDGRLLSLEAYQEFGPWFDGWSTPPPRTFAPLDLDAGP